MVFSILSVGIDEAFGEDYAFLIGPDGPGVSGYDEFWNDVVLMHDALIGTGQYNADRICVSYGSGSDKSGVTNPRYNPASSITDYAATYTGINSAFSALDSIVGNDDNLFVWTFNHGGLWGGTETAGAQTGDSYLVTTDNYGYTDDLFANKMAQLGYGSATVIMQQCSSGGFINELDDINNTLIMTACQGDESALRADNCTQMLNSVTENEIYGSETYHHGEFNFHLYCALTGMTPTGETTYDGTTINADINGDGIVTMDEVYAYIMNHDSWYQYFDGSSYYTPQLSDVYNMASNYTVYGGSGGTYGGNGATPEPGTLLLLGIGLLGLIGRYVRRKN